MVRGRKRKPGKRYPCGKRMREETEREAIAWGRQEIHVRYCNDYERSRP